MNAIEVMRIDLHLRWLDWKANALGWLRRAQRIYYRATGLPDVIGVEETPALAGHVRIIDERTGGELHKVWRVDLVAGMAEVYVCDPAGRPIVIDEEARRIMVHGRYRAEWK